MIRVWLATTNEDARLWEEFVNARADATSCHRWGWKQVIEDSFRWPTFYLMAGERDHIKGILPLVWQKSRLFGSFLTSVPFLNAGGIVAEDPAGEQALLQEAISIAKNRKVRSLELRHRSKHRLGLQTKTNKVAPVRPVGPSADGMWQAFHHKVRTDIRKATKFGLDVNFGGSEMLADFYEIFAENMRELGTPVYSPDFFNQILRAFPRDTYLCIVRHEATPIAASFLVGFRDTLEAVWSASRYAYLNMKPNMFLYWKVICMAGERGFRYFDFGRSTVGSGTHTFKKQWGTEDVQLHWDYWLPDGGRLPELNPENPRYQLAIAAWRKLPLSMTKLLGPKIVRCLP